MSFTLTFAVAVAITRGAVLVCPLWSVGIYARPLEDAGAVRYACLDLRGLPARATETWDEASLLGSRVVVEDRCTDDWSAFGAASIFVAIVGPNAARDALARLDDGARATLPMGEPAAALAG